MKNLIMKYSPYQGLVAPYSMSFVAMRPLTSGAIMVSHVLLSLSIVLLL